MNIFFLLNNIHFALEVFGALVFLMAAWLAFDAFLLRRDFLTASRGTGFFLLSFWQVIHALGLSEAIWSYIGFFIYLLGIFLVALNLFLESPVKRPEFKAIFILPPLAAAAFYVNIASAFLYAIITFLAFRQYKVEFKAALKPFWIGFLLLFLGALSSLFYNPDFLGLFWGLGHLLEFLGFAALLWWLWQYLQLRIREELVIILTSSALLIAIVVTLAFSVILVGQIEETTKSGLLTNARVMDLTIGKLKEEALAKARYLGALDNLKEAVSKNDFSALEKLASQLLNEEKLGFLLITDKNGEVILRAHALTQKEDNLSAETAVGAALTGKDFVAIESSPAEKFSVRAAVPIKKETVTAVNKKTAVKSSLIGVLVAGFPLDNAFVDNLKRVTGLEMAIFEGDTIAATTLLNPDGRTRSAGIKITDPEVVSAVLEKGEAVVLRTKIASRPALASYLPIKNENGKVIGMLSALKPQQEIITLANTTNRLTLITVVAIMLILALPIYLLTKRLSSDL